MTDISMRVEGLRDLERSLIALQEEYGGRAATQALRPAVRAAMSPLVDDVIQGTPTDTGALAESTKLRIGKPSRKMVGHSHHYSSAAVIYGAVGWHWRSPSLWRQALAVEYGTNDTPPHYTLRNAFEGKEQEIIDRFTRSLGPAIEKKAGQLARRRG